MGKDFVPTSEQRKEQRHTKRVDELYKMDLRRDKMQLAVERRVHIKAYDASFSYAFGSWLGFKPRKAVMVDHVLISTDIPLPRDNWLRVVDYLERCVEKQEKKQEAKK